MVSFHIHMLKTWICTYMSNLSKQCSVHMCKGREGKQFRISHGHGQQVPSHDHKKSYIKFQKSWSRDTV